METHKIRPGVRATIWPTTPLMLSQKTFLRFNVLVGDDPAQVRFAEQVLGVPCQDVQALRDEDILGKEGSFLFRVEVSKAIELSPNTKAMVGVWSLEPIEKGSAGANAIVKYAAGLLEKTIDKGQLQGVSDQLLDGDIAEVRASIWQAVWMLTGPKPPAFERWPEPWEKLNGWLPEGVDPGFRLNALYRFLVGFVFAKEGDEDAARKFGVSPAKYKVMRSLSLDLNRVYSSIRELSKWRAQKYNPLVCALKIRNIWEAQ